MFNNNRKTIGVFLNRAELAFQQTVSKYLIQYAAEKDYNLAFMTSYGMRGKTSDYDVNESDIIDFAPIEKYAAIIVAFDTYDTPIFRSKMVSALKKRAKGPVVSFREKSDDFYNVIADANKEVDSIVKHLVTEHNAKNIFFMAGYKEHYDSGERLAIFKGSMERMGLPLYANSIFHGDMWTRKGEEAYQYFFSDDEHKPDAIICANDFMARALCDVLIKHGVRVPEDVMVTGFDNEVEAREFSPMLTTVGLDYEKMAKETIELIHDLLNGVKRKQDTRVTSRIYYRESCGCENDDQQQGRNHLQIRTANSVMDEHMEQLFFSINMNSCSTLEEIKDTIENGLQRVGDYREFYLFRFCDYNSQYGLEDLSGDTRTKLEFGMKDGKQVREAVEFYQKDLLPKNLMDDELKVYYFRILHNRDKSFGYTVIRYKNPTDSLYAFYHDFNLTISLTLNDYYIRQQMEELILINKNNSLKDYMTKTYNRLGLDEYIEQHWNKWIESQQYITFMSVDLDGLKAINDTYGHGEGDWVIYNLACILRNCTADCGIVCRTGGDEFLMVLQSDEEGLPEIIRRNIKEQMEEINEKSKKPYVLDCSIGSYTVMLDQDVSLQECIWKSDMEMYKIKKQKKGS